MAKFTVDTQLFRELGELLVGRNSTALMELIKNSYDADAREVVVYGENLADGALGRIVIRDDGAGMSEREFEHGFLRIASRSKTDGTRRSKIYKRRFTGEKGIGRLAAHKLARQLDIISNRWDEREPKGGALTADGKIVARINWDKIEAQETLDDVEKTDAVKLQVQQISPKTKAGTTIELSKLRNAWSGREFRHFFMDALSMQPAKPLTEKLPPTISGEPLLFSNPKIRDGASKDADNFTLKFDGDFLAGDPLVEAVAEGASWIIEIDCDARSRTVRFGLLPSPAFKERFPEARGLKKKRGLPKRFPRISFQGRIFVKYESSWPAAAQGVKVYMEGFRVLPYGEAGDDWLDVDSDYRTTRTAGTLSRLDDPVFKDLLDPVDDERLVQQGNATLFGAVFLTHGGAPNLRMLVNREGFLPDENIEEIKDLVRGAIDLCTRARYAATKAIRRERKEEQRRLREATETAPDVVSPSAQLISSDAAEALKIARVARQKLSEGKAEEARDQIDLFLEPLMRVANVTKELKSEAAMLRIISGVGLHMAAFSHEINGLTDLADVVVDQLAKLRSSLRLDASQRQLLAQAHQSTQELRQSIHRLGAYLMDVVSADASRRRSRMRIRDRFEAALRLVQSSIDDRQIEVVDDIDHQLKSPPMFPAEMTLIFSNLLTNAVKAAGRAGKIRTSARDTENWTIIRMENTGRRVNLSNAEIWFRPFESTTTKVDAGLGQGMGLGLTITRSILDEYGATIRFVQPREPYRTALEIRLPRK